MRANLKCLIVAAASLFSAASFSCSADAALYNYAFTNTDSDTSFSFQIDSADVQTYFGGLTSNHIINSTLPGLANVFLFNTANLGGADFDDAFNGPLPDNNGNPLDYIGPVLFDEVSFALKVGTFELTRFNTDNTATLVVTEVASAVPEPSTWAMMILGFCGLGFMAYCRKDKLAPGAA